MLKIYIWLAGTPITELSHQSINMDNKYAGMTVNERLYVSGLLDEFDKAVQLKDVDVIISILKIVELTDENIDSILRNHGLKR